MNVALEIRHLKLLAAVAEAGSITAASKRLHLTQSALSHQLRDAEQRLGASLFLRLGKKMVPTAAGRQLLESARRILDELKKAEAQIVAQNGDGTGVIRVSTDCYAYYEWLPAVLGPFHERFPKVEVNIDLDATARPVDCLLEGHLDVAIVDNPPRNRSLRLTHLCEDEMLVVLAANHPLAARPYLEPADFGGETVLVYPPREESTLLVTVLQPAGIEPSRVLEIPLTETILEMVAAGTGMCLMARWAVMGSAQGKKIAARPLSRNGFRRDWYAVTRRHPMPECVGEFLNLLADHFPRPCGIAQR